MTLGGSAGLEALSSAVSVEVSDDETQAIEDRLREMSRSKGIDEVLREYGVDVILGPGSGPLYKIAAAAGDT